MVTAHHRAQHWERLVYNIEHHMYGTKTALPLLFIAGMAFIGHSVRIHSWRRGCQCSCRRCF